jgi:polyhydroxyalkanoate synthesis regulator phasin
MDENIWKANFNGIKGEMLEQWETMKDNDITEFEEKLEKMSDLLQEDGDLEYDVGEYYMLFY